MRIVVGVDGSEGSKAALRWALAEAEARRCPLVAMLAYGFYGRPQQVQDRTDGWDEEKLAAAASDVLHEAVAEVTAGAHGGTSGPAVTTMVAETEPVDALLDFAGEEDLVVLGSRGLGTVRRLLVGSVSGACARHADGPVVVVRGAGDGMPGGRVVVGVDGSTAAVRALDWAFEHARARGLPLHVLRAWALPYDTGVRMVDILATAADRERAEKQLHELVDERTRGAGIAVTAELRDGYPAATLVDAAGDAELLVVGSRGVGGFTRLLLGSTSTNCLLHADTSVAVIHAPQSGDAG